MDIQFLEIEQFAKLANKSVSTIRRNIKNLSETDKKHFIRRIPVIGSGGEKFLFSVDLVNVLNQKKDKAHSNDKASNENSTIQEQTKTPEHSPNEDTSIVEILRGQIEYLQKQGEVKDSQILNLGEANKELLERLKEVNYTLANTQKQISAPQDVPKWWQFWK